MGQAGPALIAGEVQVAFASYTAMAQFVKTGKVRMLASAEGKRTPVLPDVPTIAESGFPGYSSGSWFGLLAPKGTPQAIIDKLNKEVNAIMPNLEQRFIVAGADPVGKTPAHFAEFMAKETAKWKKVVEDSNAAQK